MGLIVKGAWPQHSCQFSQHSCPTAPLHWSHTNVFCSSTLPPIESTCELSFSQGIQSAVIFQLSCAKVNEFSWNSNMTLWGCRRRFGVYKSNFCVGFLICPAVGWLSWEGSSGWTQSDYTPHESTSWAGLSWSAGISFRYVCPYVFNLWVLCA